MINFNELPYSFAENNGAYSFVGIKEKKLYLPLGFKPDEGELKDSFTKKKELFFLLYRTLRKFTGRLNTYQKETTATNDRDGVGEGAATRTFVIDTEDGAEEIVYTRFSGLDHVLDGFDELRLFDLRKRMQSSDEVDYSKIHRYLDKATYLTDDTIYVDQMQMPKPALAYHTTDLVRMYCFIYCEIKHELDEDEDISVEVQAESEAFKKNHLAPADSLFDEASHVRTHDDLCDQLTRINQQTAFKDDAYWHFYEAIEAVLYPQNRSKSDDGVYWGINKFWTAWEDMCYERFVKTDPYGILYAEPKFNVNTANLNPFQKKERNDVAKCFEIKAGSKETRIKPDLVCKRKTWFLLNKERLLKALNECWELNTDALKDTKWGEIASTVEQMDRKNTIYTYKSGHDDHGHKTTWEISTLNDNSKEKSKVKSASIQLTNNLEAELETFPSMDRIDGDDQNIISTASSETQIWNKLFYGNDDEAISFLYSMGNLTTFWNLFATTEQVINSRIARCSLFRYELGYHYNPKSESNLADIGAKLIKVGPYHDVISIIDFKYRKLTKRKEETDIPSLDILKQHIYEFTIRKNSDYMVHNVFLLPGTSDSEQLNTNDGIWRATWNIKTVMEEYVRN